MTEQAYVDTFDVDIRILSFVVLLVPFLAESLMRLPHSVSNIPKFPGWITNIDPFSGSTTALLHSLYNVTVSLLAIYIILIYFFGPYYLKRKFKLSPLEDQWSKINEMVNKLSLKLGLKKPPKAYLVSRDDTNCFVFGRSKNSANIVFTEGLLNTLELEDIKSVTLHELSHILNRDMPFMTWGILCLKGLLIWLVVYATTGFLFILLHGWVWLTEYTAFKGGVIMELKFFGSNTIILFVILVFIPFLIFNSVSRTREFLADGRATLYLGDKSSLVSVLNKVAQMQFLRSALGADIPRCLCFIDRHLIRNMRFGARACLDKISRYVFSTHPTLKGRKDAIHEEKSIIRKGLHKTPTNSSLFMIGLSSLYLGLVIGNLVNFFGIMPNVDIVSYSTSNYLLEIVNKSALITVTSPVILIMLNIYALRDFAGTKTRFLYLSIKNTFVSCLSFICLFILLVNLPQLLLNMFVKLI